MEVANNFEVPKRVMRGFEKASGVRVVVCKDSLIHNNPVELHKSMFRASQHVLPPSCRSLLSWMMKQGAQTIIGNNKTMWKNSLLADNSQTTDSHLPSSYTQVPIASHCISTDFSTNASNTTT